MKIVIEKNKDSPLLWDVTIGDRMADNLAYDEMLGLIATVTMPESRPCLQWLKTKEQREAWENYLTKYKNRNVQ